jgi:hypothetical protein
VQNQRPVVIKGPNPTPTEMEDINRRCLNHLEALQEIEAKEAEQRNRAQEAAQEAKAAAQRRRLRALSAMPDVRVKPVDWVGANCSFLCSKYVELRVEVTNASIEAVSSVFVGLAFVQSISCPSETRLDLPLSPGETVLPLLNSLIDHNQKAASAPRWSMFGWRGLALGLMGGTVCRSKM